MSDPSKQDAKKKEKEVCSTSIEEGDYNMFLTGKTPFFDMVLTKWSVKPKYIMNLPQSIVSILPCVTIPTVLRCSGKNWNVSYSGGIKKPGFRPGWKKFVEENYLKVHDACIFELMENSSTKLKFKVIILRNEELPPELQANSSDKSTVGDRE